MKTLEQWYAEYGESHKNATNKSIHYICVPAIYFSIMGMLMSIPFPFMNGFANNAGVSLVFNVATIALIFVMAFYLRLSANVALKILVFSAVCLIGNWFLAEAFPGKLWLVNLIVFVVAWIGQFYGHKVEGKKPSFFKDLQFLLIGPAWVMDNLFGNKQ